MFCILLNSDGVGGEFRITYTDEYLLTLGIIDV